MKTFSNLPIIKKILGLIILFGILGIYYYGFMRFGFFNVIIPGMIASGFGFLILGGIYLVRYSK